MIELPDKPRPNDMTVTAMDFGFTQRGAASLRVDRPGNRYTITFKFPIMPPEIVGQFNASFQRAKREGLRVYLPLGVHSALPPQGLPGAPVVDGAGQSGVTLNLRGFTPHYIARVGYWFTLVEADGTGYLYSVAVAGRADSSGNLALQIEPPLRAPHADGDVAHFSKPYIEGVIADANFSWNTRSDRFTEHSVSVEEMQ